MTRIDHTVVLGRRQAIAGIERALIGMKAGGYRKVRIGPHLAYRHEGVADLIPPNAVPVVEVWVKALVAQNAADENSVKEDS